MTRGVAVDLFEVAIRVGTQRKAAGSKIWPGRKVSLKALLLWMIDGAIEPSSNGIVELSMKAPMLVSKPVDLG